MTVVVAVVVVGVVAVAVDVGVGVGVADDIVGTALARLLAPALRRPNC